MIDHVRWSITDFVEHPMSHVHDVIQRFFVLFLTFEALSHVLPLVKNSC